MCDEKAHDSSIERVKYNTLFEVDMDAFLAAVRRILRQDGEALLARAVSGLDKAKTRLHAAAEKISTEASREYTSIADARARFRLLEAESSARVSALEASYGRARRVADRIAGLVE